MGPLAANSSPAASQCWVLQNRARTYTRAKPAPGRFFWLPGCAVGWLSPVFAGTYKGGLRVRHILLRLLPCMDCIAARSLGSVTASACNHLLQFWERNASYVKIFLEYLKIALQVWTIPIVCARKSKPGRPRRRRYANQVSFIPGCQLQETL